MELSGEDLLKDYKRSLYRLRIVIGIFGALLPVLLLVIHGQLLSSMSHYYYTSACVFFIGILFAFGLLLVSYRGYPPEKNKKEKFRDDWVTTLAGICIFITALIPANSEGAMGTIFFTKYPYLFGHEGVFILNTIHLVSAGAFISLLGVMSYYKFTLSPKISKRRRKIYKICGIIIWSCVGILILLFTVDKFLLYDKLNNYFPGYTFWFEMIAVETFAFTWLIKGRAIWR